MGVARHKHAAMASIDGRVVIFGGSGRGDHPFAAVEVFDPRVGRFEPAASLIEPRHKIRDAVARLPSGSMLIAGGAKSAEIFDPTSGRFCVVPGEIGTGLEFAAVALLNDGRVLIAGGYGDRIRGSDGIWQFEP
jgi:hypothetical protein